MTKDGSEGKITCLRDESAEESRSRDGRREWFRRDYGHQRSSERTFVCQQLKVFTVLICPQTSVDLFSLRPISTFSTFRTSSHVQYTLLVSRNCLFGCCCARRTASTPAETCTKSYSSKTLDDICPPSLSSVQNSMRSNIKSH